MPFDDVETIHKDNMPPTALLSYQPFAGRNGPKKDAKPRLTIAIPTTVCGLANKTVERFVLQIGSGEDAGKLRIAPAPNNSKKGVKPSEHQHFFKFNFGYVPRLGDDRIAEDRMPLEKITDDTFQISVPPSWFEESAA